MGVVTIHGYQIPEGKTAQQAVEGVSKMLECLGGVRSGTFTVDCESFHSTPNVSGLQQTKTLNLLHDSEYPASAFALLENGMCLVSSSSFDTLLNNLSTFYLPKKSSRMESKGPKYLLGDFVVKVGSVSMGSSFRGILVEVEYTPCVVPSHCWDLLKEFMGSFMPPPRDPHSYLQGKMNDLFNPVDAIHQYNEHFNSLRKQTATSLGFTSINTTLLNTSLTSSPAMIKTER